MEMLGGSSLEGIVFLGVAWTFWIVATFFMSKTANHRLKISIVSLVMIILLPIQYTVLGFTVSSSALFLYLFLLAEVVKLKTKTGLYLFITSLIIMLAYVSFLLVELYDPVWVIFDRKWMVGFILVYLCLLLEGDNQLRYYSIFLGTLQGEWLYSIFLDKFSLSYPVGSYTYYDTVGITLILLSTWMLLEVASSFLENHTKHTGRGKQKTP
jgi:hypothetical protein